MRVIAGTFRSRRLKGTPPAGIRPTSDKLRETLFNVLGPRVENSVFLDGFAGMGGVGIEAISRGARSVCFVDQGRKACSIIRENLESLEVKAQRLISCFSIRLTSGTLFTPRVCPLLVSGLCLLKEECS